MVAANAAVVPACTAFLGWLFLSETVVSIEWLGVVLVTSGIIVGAVHFERGSKGVEMSTVAEVAHESIVPI